MPKIQIVKKKEAKGLLFYQNRAMEDLKKLITAATKDFASCKSITELDLSLIHI